MEMKQIFQSDPWISHLERHYLWRNADSAVMSMCFFQQPALHLCSSHLFVAQVSFISLSVCTEVLFAVGLWTVTAFYSGDSVIEVQNLSFTSRDWTGILLT